MSFKKSDIVFFCKEIKQFNNINTSPHIFISCIICFFVSDHFCCDVPQTNPFFSSLLYLAFFLGTQMTSQHYLVAKVTPWKPVCVLLIHCYHNNPVRPNIYLFFPKTITWSLSNHIHSNAPIFSLEKVVYKLCIFAFFSASNKYLLMILSSSPQQAPFFQR